MSTERSYVEQRLKRALEEQADILKTDPGAVSLVSMQAFDARKAEVAKLIESLQQRLVQIDDRSSETAEDRADAMRMESFRVAREDAAFWLRRFCTTLGIGNAAAFAAVASGFLQSDEKSWNRIASPVAEALTRFSIGMVVAGAMPLLLMLYAQVEIGRALRVSTNTKGADALQLFLGCTLIAIAAYSASCLFSGFGYAIGGVRGLISH